MFFFEKMGRFLRNLRLIDERQKREGESEEKGFANLEWEQALESLNEHYRTVVLLYYAEGFKTSEIAEILQIPESTVRTRLARAREKLAVHYGGSAERRRMI